MNREIKEVAAYKVHYSSLLPSRQHNEDLSKSVKQAGIQQPIIVRPIPGTQDEYEIIDGRGRRESLSDNEQIPVDVRHDIRDSGVFLISQSTFQRKDRTAYETALFYAAWLKTLEKELGSIEGLHQKLAGQANLSESSLSQYLAIARLFDKLKELAPKEQFSTLKTWSVNKLYKLSELTDDSRLLDSARLFELKFEPSAEEVGEAVDSYRGAQGAEDTPSDQGIAKPETDQSSISTEQHFGSSSDVSRKIFLKNARKVNSLASETHATLNEIVQELMQNPERLSSTEELEILGRVIRILRKLRKHSDILRKKIKPQVLVGVQ